MSENPTVTSYEDEEDRPMFRVGSGDNEIALTFDGCDGTFEVKSFSQSTTCDSLDHDASLSSGETIWFDNGSTLYLYL